MVDAYLTGIFPRSEELIEATRLYEKKKMDMDELKAHFKRETKQVVDMQVDSRFECITDGLLEWQDIFRPFTVGLSGVESGALTRWFNNNTFYRKPVVTGKLESAGRMLKRWMDPDLISSTKKDWKVIVPGPYTFARMCENRFYKSIDELILDFARVLIREIKSIEPMGATYVQLSEPALVRYPPKGDEMAVVKSAIDDIAATTSLTTSVHTYFGDLSSIYPDVLDFNVDTVGVDFYETPMELLGDHDFTKNLACGCIDARNSLVETVDEMISFSNKLFERVRPENVILCPNCDLEFLPRVVADKKVRVLGELVKALKRGEGGD